MKVLKSCQVLWKFGGVCLPESASKKDIYVSLLINVILLANMISTDVMIFSYITTEVDDIGKDKWLYSIYQLLAILSVTGTYISTSLVKRNVGKMVDSLQQVVEKSEQWSTSKSMTDTAYYWPTPYNAIDRIRECFTK